MTKEEFKTHVLPVKGKIYRLALMMLNNRPEAEDTIQDVYLKLWDMRRKLRKYNSIEALAVTVTKNLCIDKLRSYRSRNKNDGGLEKINISADGRYDPLQSVEMDESMQKIQAIIRQLPDQQRLIMQLRDIEQYNYDEIEEMTGITRNNIRVTLSRARKYVREEYIKTADYGSQKN